LNYEKTIQKHRVAFRKRVSCDRQVGIDRWFHLIFKINQHSQDILSCTSCIENKIRDIKPSHIYAAGIFSIFLMLILVPFTTNQSYAMEQFDQINWKLIFLSSYPACSNYHYQQMQKYASIAEGYLELYGLQNSKHSPECFSESKFSSEYANPNDLDLIILVYDRNLGREELHTYKIGGFYHHSGWDVTKNHSIVFCDCPTFDYSDPVWILSHELSHFSLIYLNYDKSVIEERVHAWDDDYDNCRQNWEEFCFSLFQKLRVDQSAYDYTVMSVYKESQNENLEKDARLDESALLLNKMMKEWANEGKITEDDYSKAIEYLDPERRGSATLDSEVFFTDKSFSEDEIWVEKLYGKKDMNPDKLLERIPSDFNK
jgi:hypothetical protein